jgi:hypothetical protein
MKQKTTLYYRFDNARDAINLETKEGWFVHSMVSANSTNQGKGDLQTATVLVVYRKAKE